MEKIYRAKVCGDGYARLEMRFINPPDAVWIYALQGYLKRGWHMFRMLAEMEVQRINQAKDAQ